MVTKLEQFLDRMRKEIRAKKEAIKNLGRPHSFPCPYCTKDVDVTYKPDGSAYFRHKVPGCPHYENATSRTNGALTQAFYFYCRPPLKYKPLDGIEDIDKILSEK